MSSNSSSASSDFGMDQLDGALDELVETLDSDGLKGITATVAKPVPLPTPPRVLSTSLPGAPTSGPTSHPGPGPIMPTQPLSDMEGSFFSGLASAMQEVTVAEPGSDRSTEPAGTSSGAAASDQAEPGPAAAAETKAFQQFLDSMSAALGDDASEGSPFPIPPLDTSQAGPASAAAAETKAFQQFLDSMSAALGDDASEGSPFPIPPLDTSHAGPASAAAAETKAFQQFLDSMSAALGDDASEGSPFPIPPLDTSQAGPASAAAAETKAFQQFLGTLSATFGDDASESSPVSAAPPLTDAPEAPGRTQPPFPPSLAQLFGTLSELTDGSGMDPSLPDSQEAMSSLFSPPPPAPSDDGPTGQAGPPEPTAQFGQFIRLLFSRDGKVPFGPSLNESLGPSNSQTQVAPNPFLLQMTRGMLKAIPAYREARPDLSEDLSGLLDEFTRLHQELLHLLESEPDNSEGHQECLRQIAALKGIPASVHTQLAMLRIQMVSSQGLGSGTSDPAPKATETKPKTTEGEPRETEPTPP